MDPLQSPISTPPVGESISPGSPSPIQPPASRGLLRRLRKEERKRSYDRIERLTKELSSVLKEEMAQRKDSWEEGGDQEDESHWEERKKEIYQGLADLAGEIERAIRDRKKEEVLEFWGKEMEERRAQRGESTRWGGK